MAYLKVSPKSVRDLKTVFSGGSELLIKVRRFLCEDYPPSIRDDKLLEGITEVCGDKSYAEALALQMVSLSVYRRDRSRDESEVIASFLEGIAKARDDFNEEEVSWFQENQSEFLSLLSCSAIKLPAKANQIRFDFDHILSAGSILTDLRPVFDDEHSEIVGGIVTHSLQLKYYDRRNEGEVATLTLALDVTDLKNLMEEFKKAESKAEVAKMTFDPALPGEIFVNGEH